MADHKNCRTGRLKRSQNLPENLFELRVQTFCRFVEEQNVGIQEQDLRQRRALLFAAGKVVGVTVEQLCQFTKANNLCKSLGFAFGFWQNLQQILADGGFHKQRLRILRQHPNSTGYI